MKFRHFMFVLPTLFAGSAFSQYILDNNFAAPQTAEAWVTGRLRSNTSLESYSTYGQGGFHLLNNSGTLRWLIRGTNSEPGGNSGFDFSIGRRNDAGGDIDIPFFISRGTGAVTMQGAVNAGSFRVGAIAANAERLSAGSSSLGFNRDVVANTNFSTAGHAYQFVHTSSTTAASDRLDLQVMNTSGTSVTSRAFSVNGAGNIGMGISPQADYKLTVNGTMSARRVKVTQETWADYVFQPGYKLPTIAETEAFINVNKHLPGIPSAKEVEKEGIDVGEMNKLLLQKIEEQMLYIIEMNKEMKALKEEVKELKKKNS